MKGISRVAVLLVAAACASEPLEPPATLVITTTSLPDAVPNVVFADTLEASGGDGRYTWSVGSGALPTGLTLYPITGEITGAPRTGGSWNFSIQVVSGDGQAAEQQLAITVSTLLLLTSTSVRDGQQLASYADTVTATGGVGNHTWSIAARALPVGLSLDASTGEISGTPSSFGTSTFTVQVASDDGQTAQQEFTVTVYAALQMVAGGGDHSCGLGAGTEAYCWGWNRFGQLGHAGSFFVPSFTPVRVSGGLDFRAVTAGRNHSCGITTAGSAYCWGQDSLGQLGNGGNRNRNVPVAVAGGFTFQSVTAGNRHSCAVTMAGAAYCWGENAWGQLGDATTTTSGVPVAVSGGFTFHSVTAGGYHSCGVTTAGSAYCWGANTDGQLGIGTSTPTPSSTPVAVTGGLTFQAVSNGLIHSCGVTTSEEAYCWGNNNSGQRGDGGNTLSTVPIMVAGGLTLASVASGTLHTCGVTTAGEAYCWGQNTYGQLGNNTTTDSNLPMKVSGGITFQSVATGAWHSCGVSPAMAAYCWGSGTPLGHGDNQQQNRPVPVSPPPP